MTQHRTAARRVVISLSCFGYHKMLRLLPKSKVGGIPGPEAYHKKYAQRRRLRLNSLPNEDFRLKRLCQPEKSSLFFKFNIQISLFSLLSSNCTLQNLSSNCILQILSSISALLSPDCSISNHQKLVEKVQNCIEEFWLILKK